MFQREKKSGLVLRDVTSNKPKSEIFAIVVGYISSDTSRQLQKLGAQRIVQTAIGDMISRIIL